MSEIGRGRFVRLVQRDGWEWAERTNASGVVGARVLEFPAGLAGDVAGAEDEDLSVAANRELEEETGWRAARLERLTAGPVSAGMTSEVLTFYRAHDLERVGPGGGDPTEDIVVHEIPVAEVHDWLAQRAAQGVMADPKVYAGLYFLQREG